MSADDFFIAEELLRTGDISGAVAHLRGVVSETPGHVAAWKKLSEALSKAGDETAARDARQSANAAQAQHLSDVGASLLFQGDGDRASTCFDRALAIDPDCIQAHWLMGDYLGRNDRRDEALAHYRRCMEIAPTREAPAFMAAVFGEGETPARAPDDYVEEYFDWYAHRFDEHLTGRLKYVGPQVVADTLAAEQPGNLGHVLDLGCGTGLAGLALRARADRLTGVDLSPQMLVLARERNVYDELIQGELAEAMRGMDAAGTDTVVAVDVLVYTGALEATLEQARRILRPGGVFVASFEALNEDRDWMLANTGRYLHSAGYVESAGRAAGFSVVSVEEASLREEYDKPVPSLIATFRVSG